MKFYNKSAIVENISKETGLNKKNSKASLEAIVKFIKHNLSSKRGIRVAGLGSFRVSHRKARKGRNPQTGKPMKIDACNTPLFKASAGLKRSVNK